MIDEQNVRAGFRHRGTRLGDPSREFLTRKGRAHATSQISRIVSM